MSSRRITPARVVAVATLLIVTGFTPRGALAWAVPNPASMDIIDHGKKLGTLTIDQYDATSPDASVGAALVASFVKANMAQCNYNFQWIQSIYDGKGTIGQADGAPLPYLDPYGSGKPPMREDNLPWYWTVPENSMVGTGANGTNGPGTLFSDTPSQDKRNAGNFIKFETAFVCVNGLNIHWLAGFTWGYQVQANMTSSIYDFAWLKAPTANLTAPTEAWDGTLNPKGGGKPVGYKFTDDACTCVPEPSTVCAALLGLLGAVAAGVQHSRRAQAA